MSADHLQYIKALVDAGQLEAAALLTGIAEKAASEPDPAPAAPEPEKSPGQVFLDQIQQAAGGSRGWVVTKIEEI